MAQMIVLRDDIDGSMDPTVSTITFSVEGDTYEIDLTATNKAQLLVVLEPYTNAGRVVARARAKRRLSAVAANGHADVTPSTPKVVKPFAGIHAIRTGGPVVEPNAKGEYVCPECGYTTGRAQGLGAHRRAKHDVVGQYTRVES